MDTSEQAELPVGSRRQVLRHLGLGAGVLTLGSALVPVRSLLPAASAQEAEGEEAEQAPEEGALAEPDLLAFLASVERAAADAYDEAGGKGWLTGPELAAFAQHHRDHAAKLDGLAGSAGTGDANPGLTRVLSDQLAQATDADSALKVLADLETALASTHLSALGALGAPVPDGADIAGPVAGSAEAVASILPVESAHATVIGAQLERTAADLLPSFEIVDNALLPDTFPTVETEEPAS